MFEELKTNITQQSEAASKIREQVQDDTRAVIQENVQITAQMNRILEEEKQQAAEDRQNLLLQITALVNAQAETQEKRLEEKTANIKKSILDSNTSLEKAVDQYQGDMEAWEKDETALFVRVNTSREALKTKLVDDWAVSVTGPNSRIPRLTTLQIASEHSTSIQERTRSVNARTMRVVDEQLKSLDEQMTALDDFVTRARSENAAHHEKHGEHMDGLSDTVMASFENISSHFVETFDRVRDLGSEMDTLTAEAERSLEPVNEHLREPLSDLREEIMETKIKEYQPTGETPMKTQYQYPTDLPKTKAHERLLADLNGTASPTKSASAPAVLPDFDELSFSPPGVPSRAVSMSLARMPEQAHTIANPFGMSLREVNPNLTSNLTTGSLLCDGLSGGLSDVEEHTEPLFKQTMSKRKGARKTHNVVHVPLDGRENVPLLPSAFSQSLGPKRKSPRLN